MQSTLRARQYSRRVQRSPADFAFLFTGLFVLAVMGMILAWQFWHVNRIYSGITVAAVPVGGMTRSAALSQLNQSLMRYPLPPISVNYGGQQRPITAQATRAEADLLAAVNAAYMTGRQGGFATRIAEQVVAALGQINIEPNLEIDQSQLRYVVSQIASDVRRPARGEIRVGDVVVPAQPGIDVDVEATVGSLVEALVEGGPGRDMTVSLQVIEMAPPQAEATAFGNGLDVEAVELKPLVLRDTQQGLEFAIDGATLQTLKFATQPARLDEARLRTLLSSWAEQVDVAPRDARLDFDLATSSVTVLRNSRFGRKLDIDATVAAVQEAVASGSMVAPLVVSSIPPAVDSNRIGEMGIRELVASGTTYFAGSSIARVRNIEVAAEKFEGVVIPPDGVFSFNEMIEDVTAANGFEDSLIIWGDRTAVGVGGGVCQVSTTVFRAAYAAGLPIVERYNHGYVVDWYGEPGLDATIYTPSVDFRFRNDTGAFLLVEPIVNGGSGTITFNLYGTKPDRTVVMGEPAVSDVIEPPPPTYTIDESLATGEKRQVEWAKEGMTVTVERTIVDNGETRTDTLTSLYQPWRAVYLVGPGTEIPVTPTPIVAESAETAGDSSVLPEATPTPLANAP